MCGDICGRRAGRGGWRLASSPRARADDHAEHLRECSALWPVARCMSEEQKIRDHAEALLQQKRAAEALTAAKIDVEAADKRVDETEAALGLEDDDIAYAAE